MIDLLARLLTRPTRGGAADVRAGVLPDDVEIRESAWITDLGGRLSGMQGPAHAVTLGRVIVVPPESRPSDRLLRHELAHVRQWRAEPLSFPVRYVWHHIRRGYWNNPFEMEARAEESVVRGPEERDEDT